MFAQIAAAGQRLQTFRALRHRKFRWFWFSATAQSAGRGMQFLVLGWLILERTDSVTQLGLVIFLYGAPNLSFVVLGGLFADRLDRLSPNPPKDTDGRREDSGRVGEGATGEMAGLHWGRLEVGGRSSVAA